VSLLGDVIDGDKHTITRAKHGMNRVRGYIDRIGELPVGHGA